MPARAELACGDVGEGKLAPVDDIVAATLDAALRRKDGPPGPRGQDGARQRRPDARGHRPGALHRQRLHGQDGLCHRHRGRSRVAPRCGSCRGPVSLEPPDGAEVIDVTSAADMLGACLASFEGADAAICTAAVADYTPKKVSRPQAQEDRRAPRRHRARRDRRHPGGPLRREGRARGGGLCGRDQRPHGLRAGQARAQGLRPHRGKRRFPVGLHLWADTSRISFVSRRRASRSLTRCRSPQVAEAHHRPAAGLLEERA